VRHNLGKGLLGLDSDIVRSFARDLMKGTDSSLMNVCGFAVAGRECVQRLASLSVMHRRHRNLVEGTHCRIGNLKRSLTGYAVQSADRQVGAVHCDVRGGGDISS